MPICGTSWLPATIDRFLKSYPSSTKVAEVMTDKGLGFLKGIGNPAGPGALASELVGTELAAWLGLHTLEFALINITPDVEIPLCDSEDVLQQGPGFISKKIRANTLDGNEIYLRHLDRVSDIAKLVVLDTWLMNPDRCPPDEGYYGLEPSRDNLLFSPVGRGKYHLIAFDHTHCFVEGVLWDEVGNPHLKRDPKVYGVFPEFRQFLTREHLMVALHRLAQLDRATVQQIVTSVPRDWGITGAAAVAWQDLIFERAAYVVETLPGLLLQQGELRI